MVEVERWTFTKGYQDWRSEHQLSLQYTQLGPFSGVVVQPWPVTFFGFSAHQSFIILQSQSVFGGLRHASFELL